MGGVARPMPDTAIEQRKRAMPQTLDSLRLWIVVLVILTATLASAGLRAGQSGQTTPAWPVSGPV
jgi:hypothetical protein